VIRNSGQVEALGALHANLTPLFPPFFFAFGSQFSLFLQEDEVFHQDIRKVLVYYPIHQLEADESYGEDNSAIFVNVTGSYPKHFIDILWSHN